MADAKTEALGHSWLQRNWRPMLMVLFGVIIANNYVVVPYGFGIHLELPPEKRHKRTPPIGAVMVHAGCDPNSVIKRWPHWPELCRRIADTGRDVIIVGTHEDRSESNWEDEFNAQFHMELPELAALLNVSSAYLGNDSGVGHLAAAVGLPGLMLYGPSNPVKNAPNSKVMRVLAAPAEERHDRRRRAFPLGDQR